MPHHIRNLKINAFRQLQDLELKQMGHVNLFVGMNNSGKTTVLEAISLFCRPLDPLEWISTARRREIKSSREPVLDAMRWLFPQNDAEAQDDYYSGEICVIGDGEFDNRQVHATFQGLLGDYDDETGNGVVVGAADYGENGTSSLPMSARRGAEIHLYTRFQTNDLFIQGGDSEKQMTFQVWEDQRYISRIAPEEPLLSVATVSPFSHRVEQHQVAQLSDATLRREKFNAVEIAKLLDPQILDLEILSRQGIRPTLYVHHAKTGFTPLSALGDGVRRVLTIALSLASARQGVLLIDEIETAIHKDALAEVFRWLVDAAKHFNVQLFATTHSIEAIDALLQADGLPEEIIGFRLESKDGRVSARRYAGELLYRLRHERGLDVR